jgi:uncharacterized protein YdhG (YjbR/CyaY superfamily)
MKSKSSNVAEYLEELPDDRRQALTKLRALIRKQAPDAAESMQYGMPSYMMMGEMLCALASQKAHLALYVCDSEVVEAHRAGLGKLNCGKGCIRFKKLADLPLDTVSTILKEAYKRRKAKAKPGLPP